MSRAIPSVLAVLAPAAAALLGAVALALGAALSHVAWAAAMLSACGILYVSMDAWRSTRAWQHAPLQLQRHLPAALALGVPQVLTFSLVNDGPRALQVEVFDEVDPKLAFDGLPQRVTVPAGQRVELRYTVTPRQRGLVHLGITQLRVRSLGGSFENRLFLGEARRLHVYPDFSAVARYAWLSGDRRLAQMGIKTYPRRGTGTDFKQLADYRVGDPVRHIDWKATRRHGRPVVREFQDERDQCVVFLLDCGRRMRADEATQSRGTGSHFDEALNALMLLSHVALREGDEVGAMTFGTAPGEQRQFAPRKGSATLNALMARFHDIEPGTHHSDYLAAARDMMNLHHKRALVIVLTNFRDEDAAELAPAVKLLRTRHLVLVASLRERVLRELAEQPMRQARHAFEVAAAHWFAQSRSDAFLRVVGQDALSVDVEPAQLPVALVNRYHAVKRAGLL